MIINTAPENAVEMGGISVTSEFKIRNSAKAFGILSSGLYANKIRAIIRELSCNALDSHVAAGYADRPFDLHLPTQLSPWFAIRDYGVGLGHEEVMDIYTTYFASTKTDSNDFIGALGLGSKSPFSYTDNFTITAVKNGMKRVYSAFINESNVPSVAAMGETETDDPNGVEVRFAVNDRDFYKFVEEAKYVFRYFKVMPKVSGAAVVLKPVTYIKPDVMPGVHVSEYESTNLAIMGNIAYPIMLPNATGVLGDLVDIDMCGLEIEFANGDLEFQASREGLSYTKKTIDAIRDRYQQISDNLLKLLTDKLNAIPNHWDRFAELSKHRGKIYRAANIDYNKNNPNPLVAHMNNGYAYSSDIAIQQLATECNIDVKLINSKITYTGNYPCSVASSAKADSISYSENLRIIVNIDNKKIMERVKNHFRNQRKGHMVYVLYAKDPSQPVDLDRFMREIHQPPASFLMTVADLLPAPKRERIQDDTTNLPILKCNTTDYIWRSGKDVDLANTTGTKFYFVPIKGRTAVTSDGKKAVPMKDIVNCYRDVFAAQHDIYGVRSALIGAVHGLSNWSPWFEHIKQQIQSLTKVDFYASVMSKHTNGVSYKLLLSSELATLIDDSSPYKSVCSGTQVSYLNVSKLYTLVELIDPALKSHIDEVAQQAELEIKNVLARYPMLCYIHNTYLDTKKHLGNAADYIKLVDSQ